MVSDEGGGGRCQALVERGLDRLPEAAGFLRVSLSTLYDLMARGELPYVKLGKSRRVPHQAVIDLAARSLTCDRSFPEAP